MEHAGAVRGASIHGRHRYITRLRNPSFDLPNTPPFNHLTARGLKSSTPPADTGFQVLEAADGEAALAYARRLRPDFLVTEIAIPRLDAMGLLQALALESAPPCVVVSTDQSDPELLAWARELGAHEVTGKPLNLALLVARQVRPAAGAA